MFEHSACIMSFVSVRIGIECLQGSPTCSWSRLSITDICVAFLLPKIMDVLDFYLSYAQIKRNRLLCSCRCYSLILCLAATAAVCNNNCQQIWIAYFVLPSSPLSFIHKPCHTTENVPLSHLYRRRSVTSEYLSVTKTKRLPFPETCGRRSCSSRLYAIASKANGERTQASMLERGRCRLPRLSVEHAVASECITLIMKLE